MLPGPVFHVELLTLARRKRYYVLRFLYGLLLLYLIAQNEPSFSGQNPVSNGELSIQELAEIGRMMFLTFAWAQAVVVVLMTPALVAGVIADEKQRKTLDYLLSSRLTSAEIVLGKLCARMLTLAVCLAIGLPILSLLSLFGGVDPVDVLGFTAACFTTAYLIGAFSLLISVYSRSPREAVFLASILEMVWLFGPFLLRVIIPRTGGFWQAINDGVASFNDWVGASSPLYVLTNWVNRGFGSSSARESVYWMTGLQVLFGTLFTTLAIVRLRPVFRKQGNAKGRLANHVSRKARRLLPRPECSDDALLWKERYVSHTRMSTKVVSGVVFLSVMSLLAYHTYNWGKPAFEEVLAYGYGQGEDSARTYMSAFLRALVTLLYVCWMLGMAILASSSLSREREEDTWICLIVTPLTSLEIIRAKMIGALWGTRWLAFSYFALMLSGLVCGALHPLGFLAGIVVAIINISFACALGTFFSLRARNSSRALIATVSTLLVSNGLYLLLVVPFSSGSHPMYLLGVSPFVEATALMSYDEVHVLLMEFRGMAGEGFSSYNILLAGVASSILYACLGVTLTIALINGFDKFLDRPRQAEGKRSRGMPPPREPRPNPITNPVEWIRVGSDPPQPPT